MTGRFSLSEAGLVAARRLVFEHSNDAIFIIDPLADEIVDANSQGCEMLMYEHEELIGLAVSAVHPDEMPRLQAFANTVFEEGSGWTDELTCLTKTGRKLAAEISGSAIEIGGRSHMIAIVRDITERRDSERRRLDRLRHHQELLLDAVGDGVVGLDTENRVTFLNPAGARLLGWAAEALIGQYCAVFTMSTDDPEGVCALADGVTEEHAREVLDATFYRRDRSPVRVEYISTPVIQEGAPSGCVVSFKDVSRRARLEDELRQAQKMDAIGHLAAGIAHDFNNLLTVILADSQILLAGICPNDPSCSALEGIRDGAERGAALVRQLLMFSRRHETKLEILDLNVLVENLTRFLKPIIGARIEVKTELLPDPLLVNADASQLDQIVMNLTINARDAMPNGGRLTIVTESVEVDPEWASQHADLAPGRYAKLSVSDTGVGIEPEAQARIFEPFFTTKTESGGTGLGLATVYGIVKQSEGHVGMRSTPGEGTTFTVLLPATG